MKNKNIIAPQNRVFVNRTLNMNYIRLIGFDMDYTLATYNVPIFEESAYGILLKKLVNEYGYPSSLLKLSFDPSFIIRGLVVDTDHGNILKVNRYGYVKKASHGTKFLSIDEQKKIYDSPIDLTDSRYYIIHTLFSLAEGCLFAQLVDLFDEEKKFFSWKKLFHEIHFCLDEAHQEGSLKGFVTRNPEKYLIQDSKMVDTLKNFKKYGKKLALITNSDYEYSQVVMNYCFAPFLDIQWQDLFDIIIVASNKPSFFKHNQKFLKVNRDSGLLSNFHEPLQWGCIYQGGNAFTLEKDLGLNSSAILYLGDHIYGDVVTLKKAIGWRTGLVVQELKEEVPLLEKGLQIRQRLSHKMEEKEEIEDLFYSFKEQYFDEFRRQRKTSQELKKDEFRDKISKLDEKISNLITESQKDFNPYWGEVMRTGNEESRFATMVEKYACIYLANVRNLFYYSPFKYFRPRRRYLAHDPMPLVDEKDES